jgi:demethylmacrocin O-methyltransferase
MGIDLVFRKQGNGMKGKIINFCRKAYESTPKGLARFLQNMLAVLFNNNLTLLGILMGTDKAWWGHCYTPHYMMHFRRYKYKKIKLLEIGVGGHDDPNKGGNSLRMWKYYFPFARIFGIDIFDKSTLQEPRIKTLKGSQVDEDFLQEAMNIIDGADIIIDDGSHINEHVIKSFKLLFPLLNDGGIYVIEDIQTSYWPNLGGGGDDSSMNFFKSLIDGMNYKEYLIPDYGPSYFDKNIISMHFYHNIIFIKKGNNNEESNLVRNGRFK